MRFRAQLSAAPLKHKRFWRVFFQQQGFRAQLSAAPLKPSYSVLRKFRGCGFRAQLSAAPLKLFSSVTSTKSLPEWFPRSIERGPVEARLKIDHENLAHGLFPRSIERGPVEALVDAMAPGAWSAVSALN